MPPPYKSHPYADLFPMMSAVELEALAEDVAANGLWQPVVRYQGLVLDGRNRLLACEKVGVEPTFTDHQGDDESALALVISLNVQRRDMTPAQRAIVAARALAPLANGWGGDRRNKSSAGSRHLKREDVARAFKVGKESVQQAKALLEHGPDLAVKVETCAVPLAAAYEQLQERRKHEAQRQKDLARIAQYREAVSNGEMTFEQAMEKALQDEREKKEDLAAEADARREWLKDLAGFLDWAERFIDPRTDEHLAWYTEPDSPGLFDHGITAERVVAAAGLLRRVAKFSFGGCDGQSKK